MASVNNSTSSSFMNMYGIKNSGIGGLVSGLNTDEIVEALVSGTRSKIQKQNQQKQLLTWQRTAYRSLASTLSAFREKNFMSSGTGGSASNIASYGFFSTYKGTSSSSKVTINSSGTSATGTVTIDKINQLATPQTIKVAQRYNKELTNEPVELGSSSYYNKTLSLTIDGNRNRTIRLDTLDNVPKTTAEKDAFYQANFDKYSRYLEELGYNDASTDFSAITDQQAYEIELQYLVDQAVGTRSQIDPDTGEKIPVDPMDLTKGYKTESIVDVSITDFGSTDRISISSQSNRITVSADCDALGFTQNQTNQINLNDSVATALGLTGTSFSFSINGLELTVNASDSMQTLMTRINSAATGVKLTFSTISQQFTFTADKTGSGNNIDIHDVNGDLMRTFIGARGSGTMTSGTLNSKNRVELGYDSYSQLTTGFDLENFLSTQGSGGKFGFNLTVNGQTKTIEIDDVPAMETDIHGNNTWGGLSAEEYFEKRVSLAIKDQFGANSGVSFDVYLTNESDPTQGYTVEILTPSNAEVQYGGAGYSSGVDLFDELGQGPGASLSNVNSGATLTKLSDLLEGDSGKIEIKDINNANVEITWNKDETLKDFLARVNLEYDPSGTHTFAKVDAKTGKVTFTAAEGQQLGYKDVEGKAINKLTNPSSAPKVDLGYDSSKKSTVTNFDAATFLAQHAAAGTEFAFELTINGRTETITIGNIPTPSYTSDGTALFGGATADKYFSNRVKNEINKAFGKDVGVTIELGLTSKDNPGFYTATIKTPNNTEVQYGGGSLGGAADLFAELGFGSATISNDNNSANQTKLSDIFKDGLGEISILANDGSTKSITWNGSDNLRDFVNAINTAYDQNGTGHAFATVNMSTGRLTLNAEENQQLKFSDVSGDAVRTLFGKRDYDSMPSASDAARAINTSGQNCEIVVDGKALVFDSNTCTVDGISFIVSDTHTGTTEKITLTSRSDPDELIDKIKEFVSEYNVIVTTLNKLLTESKSSGYDPLTDEQRAEMSETQIANWEAEAKKGLLRNDNAIRTILNDMRAAVNTKVEAAGLSLYDIGITVVGYTINSSASSYSYETAGTLEITPANETKLRNMIEQNPEAVKTLFAFSDTTKAEEMGIGHLLKDAIYKAVDTTPAETGDGYRGTLINLAGTATMTDNNILTKKINKIDTYISTLKTKLQKEYSRHWAKFTALETAIQKMNTQSSWLTDFGS